MSTLYQYTPVNTLNQFIELVWIETRPNIDIEVRHHAPLFTELIFNYEGNFSVYGEHIVTNKITGCNILLSGLKKTPFTTEVSGKYITIGLIMKPSGYRIVTPHFYSSLMSDIADRLYDALIQNKTPNFKDAEKILTPLFQKLSLNDKASRIEKFIRAHHIEDVGIKHIIKEHAISSKHLIHIFKDQFQITPNQYLLLNKVNHAIHLKQTYPQLSQTQIALNSGFYDQAHFIRTFKKFCGDPPTHFFSTKNVVPPLIYK
ncbi:AraC family transcriptional regulator [Halosquirtibacter xylanolyticus]|uniref:helix-turn-helix domain-containing protein n=1 Tax=Halosquirtibacter xylanolyticus TaxID=3374599 RepID=UPI003748E42D|nr:AraC family transcriptional regulator [Prolixibacteraceae bacterium]